MQEKVQGMEGGKEYRRRCRAQEVQVKVQGWKEWEEVKKM
jgi:hypothetical protein